MRTALAVISAVALAACVSGDPFIPRSELCADVVIYISWSDTTMVTDSIEHHECPEKP